MFDPASRQRIYETFTLSDLIKTGESTEVQTKVLIDEATYRRLFDFFTSAYGTPVPDLLIQTRYRAKEGGQGDLRLRVGYNPSTLKPDKAEIIRKEDKPGEGINADSRIEIKEHPSLKLLALLRKALDSDLRVHHDPHWLKLKDDFYVDIQEAQYRVSLQYLEAIRTPMGYVVEVSIKIPGKITRDTAALHKQRINSFLEQYGLREDKDLFEARKNAFIEENKDPETA